MIVGELINFIDYICTLEEFLIVSIHKMVGSYEEYAKVI